MDIVLRDIKGLEYDRFNRLVLARGDGWFDFQPILIFTNEFLVPRLCTEAVFFSLVRARIEVA